MESEGGGMNLLETHLQNNGLPEVATMNMLQEYRIISDNCILACDVADQDCIKAVEFLKGDLL